MTEDELLKAIKSVEDARGRPGAKAASYLDWLESKYRSELDELRKCTDRTGDGNGHDDGGRS